MKNKTHLHFFTAESLENLETDLLTFCINKLKIFLHIFHAMLWGLELFNRQLNGYRAWSLRTVAQHSGGKSLSGFWRAHWLWPSASSRKNRRKYKKNKSTIIKSTEFRNQVCPFQSPASSTQAGFSYNTSRPCCACAASAGALRPKGDAKLVFSSLTYFTCV